MLSKKIVAVDFGSYVKCGECNSQHSGAALPLNFGGSVQNSVVLNNLKRLSEGNEASDIKLHPSLPRYLIQEFLLQVEQTYVHVHVYT
jgi:hypothetical protein